MSIKLAKFTMVGHGPILYSAPVHQKKRDDEKHDQLEERTWKQKATVDGAGNLCISAIAVHRSLVAAGKWLSMKLEGKKTFTKRFAAGVMCHKPLFQVLRSGKPLHSSVLDDDAFRLDLYVPSDGKQGGTKRVWKTFPRVLPEWSINVELLLTDEAITEDALLAHARASGLHDGIGSMRIGNMGPNGMWEVDNLQLADYTM